METVKDKIAFQRCQSEIHHTKVSDSLLSTDEELNEKAEKEKEKDEAESKFKSSPKSKPSFLIALIKSFGLQFLLRQVLQAIRTALSLIDPIIFG